MATGTSRTPGASPLAATQTPAAPATDTLTAAAMRAAEAAAAAILAPETMTGALVPYGTAITPGARAVAAAAVTTAAATYGNAATAAELLQTQQHMPPTHDAQGRLMQASPYHTANGTPIVHHGLAGQQTPASATTTAGAVNVPAIPTARPTPTNPYERTSPDPVVRALYDAATEDSPPPAPPVTTPPATATVPAAAGPPAAAAAASLPDTEMEDATATMPTNTTCTGGIGTLLSGVDKFVSQVIVASHDAFITTVENNKIANRIKKATTPAALEQDAEEIATRASPRSDSTHQAMADLVKLETNKATAALQRKIASLQGQLDSRKDGRAGKKKVGGKKKDFRSRGKTAGRNDANNKTRAEAAGPGNATGTAARKQKKKNFNDRSNGKKGGSATAKRS